MWRWACGTRDPRNKSNITSRHTLDRFGRGKEGRREQSSILLSETPALGFYPDVSRLQPYRVRQPTIMSSPRATLSSKSMRLLNPQRGPSHSPIRRNDLAKSFRLPGAGILSARRQSASFRSTASLRSARQRAINRRSSATAKRQPPEFPQESRERNYPDEVESSVSSPKPFCKQESAVNEP